MPLVVHEYKDQRWTDPWWYEASPDPQVTLPHGRREEGNSPRARRAAQHQDGGTK